MENRPIADYALLSDCRSAALVSSIGSVDWLCFPDFDSQSVFGRLLDTNAGHWSICPRRTAKMTRRYLENTMVLETTFVRDSGTAVLTDGMALGLRERGHDIGGGAFHCLLRSIACTAGEVKVDVEYAPRPEYGLVVPLLESVTGGIYSSGGAAGLVLSTPREFDLSETDARASFVLKEGQVLHFALQHHSALEHKPDVWTQAQVAEASADTVEGWRSWSRLHQNYQGPWRGMVAHSGRVLQALTYYPTGAIVAAATTSLPEVIGGDRNWDYRFTWVRDSSFTLEALWVAACPDEAHKFFKFLAEVALTNVRTCAGLQIMFGIRGEHDLTERTLPHLAGWRNSRPVPDWERRRNQRQLDVYGELVNAVYVLRDHIETLDQSSCLKRLTSRARVGRKKIRDMEIR